jgi:flagellar biosynthesis protein FlhA
VPAFITALGAGLIVTRSSTREELGEQVVQQIATNPKPLLIAGGFLAMMAFTGLPPVPLLLVGGSIVGLAILLGRSAAREEAAADRKKVAEADATARQPVPVEKLLEVDALEVEVGYGLVRLVDAAKGGNLLDRVQMIRQQLAADLGLVVPPVRIRDGVQLGANDYHIKVRGQTVATGEAYPDQFLAMNAGSAAGELRHATATTEPAFGLPAYWITEPQKPEAELMNYTVVEAIDVVATHLTEIVRRHAHELLGRQDVSKLLDGIKQRAPALVEEVVPAMVKIGELQKVLQNLLKERVPIRDLESVLETLGDWAGRTKDLEVLGEYCRHGLARTICKQHVDEQDRLHVVTLDPALEDLVRQHVQRDEKGGGSSMTMPPQTVTAVVQKVAEKVADLTATGRAGLVLCSPEVRLPMRRLLEGTLPQVAVLGYNEVVPGVEVEAVGMAGLN